MKIEIPDETIKAAMLIIGLSTLITLGINWYIMNNAETLHPICWWEEKSWVEPINNSHANGLWIYLDYPVKVCDGDKNLGKGFSIEFGYPKISICHNETVTKINWSTYRTIRCDWGECIVDFDTYNETREVCEPVVETPSIETYYVLNSSHQKNYENYTLRNISIEITWWKNPAYEWAIE